MSSYILCKFGVFQREFLQNYLVYRAQILRHNWNFNALSIFRNFFLLALSLLYGVLRIVFHALVFILALRQVLFIQTSSVWLKLLQYVVTFKQANVYAHPQARARRRAQLLKITIHQLLHYCRLRQCYRVPFRLVIYFILLASSDNY